MEYIFFALLGSSGIITKRSLILFYYFILECTTSRDCRINRRGSICDRNGRCCDSTFNGVCMDGGGGRGMKFKIVEKIK